MPKAIEDVIAKISNLAREMEFFDLFTYIFTTRALEMEILRKSEARSPEEIRIVLSVTKHIDSTIFNAIRQLYPFLFSMEVKQGVEVGYHVLKVIHGIEKAQAELDMLILEDAMNGRIEKVYEELLKILIKSMVLSDKKLLKFRR